MHFKVFSTNLELESAGAYWQRQLRLQDWEIDYVLGKAAAVGGEATCKVRPKFKTCTIKLLRHDNCDYAEEYDMEHALVHELLHIYFDPFFDNDEKKLEHVAQEQAIDVLASTLVRLNRGLRR